MLLVSTNANEACYRDNPDWWARSQLGLSFKFEYLCDLVTHSSGDDLSALIDNRTDWSNELLRGVPNLVGGKTNAYGIKTYFPAAPYMLPAGTAWLEMDTAKAPMNNVDFRRAVAYAIDPSAVISGVYTGTVTTANPTGLLPYLSPFINNVAVKSYGFQYSPSMAKQFLEKSGYDGQHLTLEVPLGWTDWMGAATELADQLNKVGIHVSAKFVPLTTRNADLERGELRHGHCRQQRYWAYSVELFRCRLPSAGEHRAKPGDKRRTLFGPFGLVIGAPSGHYSPH